MRAFSFSRKGRQVRTKFAYKFLAVERCKPLASHIQCSAALSESLPVGCTVYEAWNYLKIKKFAISR